MPQKKRRTGRAVPHVAPAELGGRPSGARRTRRRRTQEERSAETRALLLSSTLECLADLGYARTSSQVIAERAGLSRGAQLHHFGTKAQLVAAALEELFERRVAEFRRGIEKVTAPEARPAATLDLLWNAMTGPAGYAYLELVGAARTDPELRKAMIGLTRRLDEQIDRLFRELFSPPEDLGAPADVIWTGIFALLEGLALERVVRPGDERVEAVIALLRQMAPLALTSPARPAPRRGRRR